MKDKYNKDEGFYIKAGWYAEDSVVLTREELQEIIVKAKVKEREKISELKKEIKELYKLLIQEKEGSFWDGVNEGILKGSKETAEKILCELLVGFSKNFYLKNMSMTEEEFGWVLDEIAREFGVEIKG